MHGWIRNPKAPSSLWDGLVLDGAYAGLHPHTNRFTDGSGLENHGTLTNMDAASDWVWSDELQGQALDFDGANDYCDNGTKVSLISQFSVSFWLSRLSGNNVWQGVLGRYSQSELKGWGVTFFTDNNRLKFGFRSTFGDYWSANSNTVFALNQWYHVAIAYPGNGTTPRLYIHGIEETGLTTWLVAGSALSGISAPGAPMLIGGSELFSATGVKYGNVQISNLLCHQPALAPDEITWLADRSNRMYTPDTRRHFWFPMSRPWLYARTSSVIIGGGIA